MLGLKSTGRPSMEFYSGFSAEADTRRAIETLSQEAAQSIRGSADLILVFFSPHHRRTISEAMLKLMRDLSPKVLLGCSGEGIIGTTVEMEGKPAFSLWAAKLPGVTLTPFHLSFEEEPHGVRLSGWPTTLPKPDEGVRPFFITLVEPFSTPAHEFLEFLERKYPGAPVLGGMASGAQIPAENLLLINGEVVKEGVVGVCAHGAVLLEAVVSQGCRPVGELFRVTHSERNVIHELSGRPALQRLTEVFKTLSEEEKQLAQHGLHIGCASDEQKERFSRGDFLVRNLIGIDEENGSLAVGDLVNEGQTVQFHVRDAESAREDLRILLEARKGKLAGTPPLAALLFSCNGRGVRFFGKPNQDVEAVQQMVGKIPLAGFFAQGEIGPIGKKNFLHGFTASIVLFCGPKSEELNPSRGSSLLVS